MVNLFGQNKKVFDKKEKPKNEMYSLIYWYLNLIGQGNIIDEFLVGRWKKAAASLLKKGTPEEVRARVLESKEYYESKKIDWSLGAVATNWGKILGKEKLIMAQVEAYNNAMVKQSEEFDRKYNQPIKPRTPEEQEKIDKMFATLKETTDTNQKKFEEEQRQIRLNAIKERLGYKKNEKIITDREIAEMLKKEKPLK
jgi:hypothetical protein